MPARMAMVMDGLFDEFPKLEVLAIEAGCCRVPYATDRLDEKYQHFFGCDLKLELGKPSEYFRRNLWFVGEPEERSIGAALELVGEDRILWNSDSPHIDSHALAVDQLKRSIAQLPEKSQNAVLGGNA